MSKERSRPFFLFNTVSPNKGLKKDEVRMVSKILCTVCFVLILIDVIAVMFFIKTNKRIKDLRDHNFTKVIEASIVESAQEHYEYAKYSKELIKNENINIKQRLSLI